MSTSNSDKKVFSFPIHNKLSTRSILRAKFVCKNNPVNNNACNERLKVLEKDNLLTANLNNREILHNKKEDNNQQKDHLNLFSREQGRRSACPSRTNSASFVGTHKLSSTGNQETEENGNSRNSKLPKTNSLKINNTSRNSLKPSCEKNINNITVNTSLKTQTCTRHLLKPVRSKISTPNCDQYAAFYPDKSIQETNGHDTNHQIQYSTKPTDTEIDNEDRTNKNDGHISNGSLIQSVINTENISCIKKKKRKRRKKRNTKWNSQEAIAPHILFNNFDNNSRPSAYQSESNNDMEMNSFMSKNNQKNGDISIGTGTSKDMSNMIQSQAHMESSLTHKYDLPHISLSLKDSANGRSTLNIEKGAAWTNFKQSHVGNDTQEIFWNKDYKSNKTDATLQSADGSVLTSISEESLMRVVLSSPTILLSKSNNFAKSVKYPTESGNQQNVPLIELSSDSSNNDYETVPQMECCPGLSPITSQLLSGSDEYSTQSSVCIPLIDLLSEDSSKNSETMPKDYTSEFDYDDKSNSSFATAVEKFSQTNLDRGFEL